MLTQLTPSQEAAQLAVLLGNFVGLDKSVTVQLAVNAAIKVNPALKPAAEQLKFNMNYSFNQTVSITTPAFPPVEERLQTLVEVMKTLADLTLGRLDPHLEQHFLDCAANMLAEHNRQYANSLCH